MGFGTFVLAAMLAIGCNRREPASTVISRPEPPMTVTPDATPDAPPSVFQGISLHEGMARAEVEKLVATALGKESEYSPYGNNLRGGTVVYTDERSGTRLEVDYNPGGPAPWVMRPDGVAEHLPPKDESVKSFRVIEP